MLVRSVAGILIYVVSQCGIAAKRVSALATSKIDAFGMSVDLKATRRVALSIHPKFLVYRVHRGYCLIAPRKCMTGQRAAQSLISNVAAISAPYGLDATGPYQGLARQSPCDQRVHAGLPAISRRSLGDVKWQSHIHVKPSCACVDPDRLRIARSKGPIVRCIVPR